MAINGKGKPVQFVDHYGKRWAILKGPANHYISYSREENLKKELEKKIREVNEKDAKIVSLNQDVNKLQGENSQLKIDKTNLENKLNAVPTDWNQQINDAKKQIADAYNLLNVKNNEEIKTILAGRDFKKVVNDATVLPATEKERNDLRKGINDIETHLQDFKGEMDLAELEKKLATLNQKLFTDIGLPITYDVLRETIDGIVALDKANRTRLGT